MILVGALYGAPAMPRLVATYLRSSVQRERLFLALNACFDGFWLGLMDRDALGNLDQAFYKERREVVAGRRHCYVDDGYNLQGLHEWEATAINAHFAARSRVIITGAGAGREVLALAERGFDAVGFEPNSRLQAAGADFLHRHGYPERLHLLERDAFPPAVEYCEAIIVGWGSYMLIPGRARRVAFLRSAREVLPRDAPILLSFFLRPPRRRYFQLVAAVANPLRGSRGLERVEHGDTLAPNFVHYFTREEIQAELEEARFRLVSFAPIPYGHAVGRAA